MQRIATQRIAASKPAAGAVAVLWTPWGPVPDTAGRGGKVTRLHPREQQSRHKRGGLDAGSAETASGGR